VRGPLPVKEAIFTFAVTWREAAAYSRIRREVVQEFNNIADRIPPLRHIGEDKGGHDGNGEADDEYRAAQRRVEDDPALTRLAPGKLTRASILAAPIFAPAEMTGTIRINGPVRHFPAPFLRRTMGAAKRSKEDHRPESELTIFPMRVKARAIRSFPMRGLVPSIQTLSCSGLAAGSDGVRMSSVLFMAKTTSKTTAKTV
jgi:hypothetical protein